MRFKITERQILFLIILFFSVILILVYWYSISRPIYAIKYFGAVLAFRENLREAIKIPVYPDENTLHMLLTNSSLQNITLVFKDAGVDKNSYYIVEEIEIINKLYFLYKIKGMSVKFNASEVQNYENLAATKENLIIALIHPIYANETSIKVENNVIYLQGTDLRNFDLATIKLLMVALDLKV